METRGGDIVQLFYNRTAGGHCPQRLAKLRCGFEAAGARVILSECGPGSVIAIDAEASHICALGGDGTVRHIAHAVSRCGRTVPMSVYPAGTVNLLHRELGFSLDPGEHVRRALAGDADSLHYPVELNDTLFLACASVGPDSYAVHSLSSALKRRIGRLAYAAALLRLLVRWPRHAIKLECDGRTIVCEAFYVAKGRFFAGPWSFAPDARLVEPKLHVVAMRDAGRLAYARFAWTLFRDRRADALPGVTAITCTALTATASAPLPVQADGDIVATLPIAIRLHADPMRFC